MISVQKLFDTYVFLYIMGVLCAIGILIKLCLYLGYRSFIKASDSVSASKKRWMKQMKMKFETCYQLKIGVNNVDVFVDKYVSKQKFCGILLSTWENISGQMITLCLLTASCAGVLGIIKDCGKEIVLFTFFMGAVASIFVIIVDNIVNITEHKKILFLNLKDYFENYLKVRLEREHFYPEELNQYRKEYFASVTESKLEMASAKEVLTQGIQPLDSSDIKDKQVTYVGVTKAKEQKIEMRLKEPIRAEVRQANIKVINAKKIPTDTKNHYETQVIKDQQVSTEQMQGTENEMDSSKPVSKRAEKKAAKLAKKEKKETEKLAKKAAILFEKKAKKDNKLAAIEEKQESKKQKKLAKQEAVSNKKQERIDKHEAVKTKKQERLAAMENEKQARFEEDNKEKQERMDAKRQKKESIQKQKEEQVRQKQEKKMSEHTAYQNKMRLKEEKELEKKKAEEKAAKLKLEEEKTECENLVVEFTVPDHVDDIIEEINHSIKNEVRNNKIESAPPSKPEQENMVQKSKEDKLIEEVLREFLA